MEFEWEASVMIIVYILFLALFLYIYWVTARCNMVLVTVHGYPDGYPT